MEAAELRRAVEAGKATASSLGLQVDDAIVINNSDRIAMRLTPCDVLARVATAAHRAGCELEVEVSRRVTEVEGPVAELESRVEPGVHVRDDFVVSLWTYYEPLGSDIAPDNYADALIRYHAALRRLDLKAPHFTDRVADALSAVDDPEQTPDLLTPDRELLRTALSSLTTAIRSWQADEQLLHGEAHPGNVLNTSRGPLLIDLGTCCGGPIEFDLAHAPDAVAAHYPGANHDLVAQCRVLMWAMITTWRWRRDDQLPNRDYWRTEGLDQVRAGLDRA